MHANGSSAEQQPGLDRSSALRQRQDAPLGTLIYRAGLLPADEIERVLAEAVRQKRKLGQLLLERNMITEQALAKLLADQKGLPFTSLRERSIDEHAVALIDRDNAWRYSALPIGFDNGTTIVAIEDPSDEDVRSAIVEEVGQNVEFVVAPRSEVLEALARFFPSVERSQPPRIDSQVVQFPTAAATAAPGADKVAAEAAPEVAAEAAPEVAAEATPDTAPKPVTETAAEPALPVAGELRTEPVAEPEPVAHAPEPVAAAPELEPTAVAPEPQATPGPETAPAPEAQPAPVMPTPAAAVPAAPPSPTEPPTPAHVAPVTTPPAPAPAPVAETPAPAQPPAQARESAIPPVAPTASEPPASASASDEPSGSFVLVVRMSDDERVEVGTFASESDARLEARALMREVAESSASEWPFVAGRFLRPDRIVSIDVVAADATG